jgi:hypothetical protein
MRVMLRVVVVGVGVSRGGGGMCVLRVVGGVGAIFVGCVSCVCRGVLVVVAGESGEKEAAAVRNQVDGWWVAEGDKVRGRTMAKL